jgi:hypothetical protein
VGDGAVSDLVDRTDEHLWMISMLHYAAAGATALFGSFPLLHVALGAFMALMPDSMRGTGPNAFPREAGFMFMGIGLVFVAAGWGVAAAHFFTARSLRQRRRYWFCVAVSALSCFICMFTSGIVGIASLVVLFRPGVQSRFAPG